MNKITTFISRRAKKPTIFFWLAILMVFNILMNTPGLPTSTPSMQKISPTFNPFDLQAKGYNLQSFTNDLNLLGENGRAIYKNFMLLDIFFPFIYGVFFASLIWLVFRSKTNFLKYLFLIPLCTALFDYAENLFLTIGFYTYPNSSASIIQLASLFTQGKMVFNGLMVVSLLTTLIYWIVTKVKVKKTTAH